jgi:hypothetical protein
VHSTASNNAIVGNSISVDEGYYGIFGTGLLQAPVITAAYAPIVGPATVAGTVTAAPFSSVRVELFASPAEPTASVPTPIGAEGQTYLGYVNVTTNAAGTATFRDTVARTAGEMITATATEGGSTSEFSSAVTEFRESIILPPHLFI